MISAIQKHLSGNIELTITIPSQMVKKTWEEVVEEAVKNAEIAGFRKGKAPRKLVEERLEIEKIREEVLRKLLPIAYAEAIKTHNIKAIINPKVHVEKLEDDKDWKFIAITCEMPVIKLNKYKDAIQKITAAATFDVAKSPAQGKPEVKFEDIVRALLDNVTAEIPAILVDNQTDRLLSQTLDEVKRLGMTLDQYLQSTDRNPQILREEYEKKAENDIRLEFALQKIAEEEKLVIEDKEIDEAIQKANPPTGGDDERKNLESNRYLLASILRQQKTLDFLKNL